MNASKERSVAEVAQVLCGEVKGQLDTQLSGLRTLEEAGEHDLSFLHRRKYLEAARRSRAGAIIVGRDNVIDGQTVILVDDPRRAYRAAIDLFYPAIRFVPSVSSTAIVESSAKIGKNVHIGAGAIIAADVVLLNGATIMAGAVIGDGCRIGYDAIVHSGAVLYPGCVIGDRAVIHACAVIGKDGFGFHREADGRLNRVRQVGTTIIGDDVEVGACTCVDRGTLSATRIANRTKIDSLVMIGHNADVGADCLVIGQTGIAGSARIGAGSNLYGQVGVRGHVRVGEHCTVLARGAVIGDIESESIVGGMPAVPAQQWRRVIVAMTKLPEFMRSLRQLSKQEKSRQ